jgi:hypothetical protein
MPNWMPRRNRHPDVGHRCAHPNLRIIASIKPVLRREHRQSVLETRPVALRVDRTGLPRWRHFATHRRSLRIDAAIRGFTDRASQCHAVRLRGVGAAHRKPVWIKLFGEFWRHAAAQRGLRLRPVKRHAKGGATGTAAQTGMFHRTGQRAPHGAQRANLKVEDLRESTRRAYGAPANVLH